MGLLFKPDEILFDFLLLYSTSVFKSAEVPDGRSSIPQLRQAVFVIHNPAPWRNIIVLASFPQA
jgi:hypothetical protein